MTYSSWWRWVLDKNPDLRFWQGIPWTYTLKRGEHIQWACANPACKDADGKRTVFDRGTNLRGSEFCPKCREAQAERKGHEIDPEIQASVDQMGIDEVSGLPWWHEDSDEAQAELYRWKRERINPVLASRWLDLFKE